MNFEEMKKQNILLKVENLKKFFPVYGGFFSKKINDVKAVDDISFDIYKGETLGLVGESGCGKSTTGRTIIDLYEPTEGNIYFADYKNENCIELSQKKHCKKELRKNMQMIFQDPYASLNPRFTVQNIVEEPLIIHDKKKSKHERERIVKELLEKVGLEKDAVNRYPHEFSGGQRQRIGIARAIALRPSLVIADEPVSSLDVSVQAQVLNVMKDLQKEFALTYLFIAHDLSVVEHISDRIAVMYLGNIVEICPSQDLYKNPLHPYTKALMSSVPIPDPKKRNRNRITLKGDVPSPVDKPSGCPFRTRCSQAQEICSQKRPDLKNYGQKHYAACHFINK